MPARDRTAARRPFAKALWVGADRVTTPDAIDDLLADSVGWNVRDLVVRGTAVADERFDPLAHLVRGGAAVGVRIHAALPGPDADPTAPIVRSRSIDVLVEIASRYAVEGLHLGDLGDLDDLGDRRATDARSPDDGRAVTAFLRQAALRLRAMRPDIVLSATLLPDPARAGERVGPRRPEWVAAGLVDLLFSPAHREDPRAVARLLSLARAAAPDTRLWGGLRAYAGERERVRTQVRAARDAGCDGAILFCYDPAKRDVLDAFAAEAER